MKAININTLTSLGYKFSKQHDSNLYQRKIDTDFVCDLNDKLHFNIKEYELPIVNTISYTIGICAEKKDIWYDLKIYSLNEEELMNNLEKLEKQLLTMWSTLKED